MSAQRDHWWYTASELAQLGLPGLPADGRKLRDLAKAEGWADRTDGRGQAMARRRNARGGGTEFHVSVLPVQAQEVLTARRNREAEAPIADNDTMSAAAEAWDRFNRQPDAIKNRAKRRMAILAEVDELVAIGTGRTAATKSVASKHGVSPSAVAGWYSLVSQFPNNQWLPRLAPNYKGGGKLAEIDPEAWQMLKSECLRKSQASFASAYYHVLENYCRPRGLTLPSIKTMRARYERETPVLLKKLRREGLEAVRKTVPPQRRTVKDLYAMYGVNIDGHTVDVRVQWEDGKIGRPVLVGIQDIYSRKILAYRIDRTESTVLARMALVDLFRQYGIPKYLVADNGRAFMSKALTGGQKTRYRFRIKDSDPIGVLTQLGIKVGPTLPYRGSSKPIERAWKDICENVWKSSSFEGAYTGNKPDAKPDNYGERAIPIAEFERLMARGFANHNSRPGRQTEIAKGRSFDAAFAESYAASIIEKATEAQILVALLEAEEKRCNRENGSIKIAGNLYWSQAMIELAGQKVTVRCDPDDLHSGVHIYLQDGRYFGFAPCEEPVGFEDKAGAARRAKMEKALRRHARQLEQSAALLEQDQLREIYEKSVEPEPEPPLVPAATRLVRHRGHSAAAQKLLQEGTSEPTEDASIIDFSDALTAGMNRLRVVE
ncbi:transposase domain-containing protein [Novosphingobium sp. NDB2Meth1]|uniref:transposase domain-containing protein n=1 Tax=Novosphingobium sp. NDB2Meth1 TaxID=1892847 RepID=UPI000930A9CC|nr:transposase domain-containing protein [Novosphingobium sp. NDB2Meth1]